MNVKETYWTVSKGGLVVLVATAFIFFRCCFSYTAVCSQCGAEEYAREWKLPFSDFTLFTHSSVKTTVLSRYLSSSGLVRTHSHKWLFAAGSGNGVQCAIGGGRHLWSIVRAPNSPQLLEAMRLYDGPDEARKFLSLALDPAVSQSYPMMLIGLFPANGFSDKAQYHAWLSENDFLLDEANKERKNL